MTTHSYNELHQRCLQLEQTIEEKNMIIGSLKRRIERMEEGIADLHKRYEVLINKVRMGME